MAEDSLNIPTGSRMSLDSTSINLNDDLSSEHSSQITDSISSIKQNDNHKRSGSTTSFPINNNRTSIDNESVFSSNAYFSFYNLDESSSKKDDIYSPLGPNSIYELTSGSDIARARRNRPSKTSVTINGGARTVYNLNIPTTKDIPQIQLSKLKTKVANKELQEKYIKKVSHEYKNFETSYKLLTEDTLQRFTQQENMSTSSSVGNLQIIDSISDIPSVFLNPDFQLDDPRTFKQVIEDVNISPGEDDDPALSLVNNTELQDKLSNYLDIVEQNLIQEIGKSSDSFFNAIGDIERIQSRSNNCVESFNGIMHKLQELEVNQSEQGLKVLRKLIEKKNVEHLESSLLQIQYITSIFSLANKSFSNGKYSKCLNEIVLVENLLRGVNYEDLIDDELKRLYPKLNYPLVNLTSLPAFVHLRNDLFNLKHECSKGYIDDFIDLLTEDLTSHYKNIPTRDTLNRIYVNKDKTRKYNSRPVNNSYLNVDDTKRAKIREIVKDLGKAGSLSLAYTSYQHRFVTEIKDIIKQNLPSAQQSTEMSSGPSRSSPAPEMPVPKSAPNALSTNIKSLTPREFETIFSKTCAELSECLRRLTVHQKLLLDIALTTLPPNADIDIMTLDITSAINKAIDLTQIRLMKVISVRSEQTADLPVQFYLRLYSITSAYLQECELINPGFAMSGAGNALGEWFSNHITYFVHRFHVNTIGDMSTECTREVWKEVLDPIKLTPAQVIINDLLEYSKYIESNGTVGFSGEKWLQHFDFYDDGENKVSNEDEAEVLPITKLKIGNDMFMVPNLSVRSTQHIRDYLIIAKAFPSFSPTVENNLLNYFKVMNSKASQAVLNAGATRTAGLKHITTKHLALCIQFVEFNISLLEGITGCFKSDGQINGQQSHGNQQDELSITRIISNYKDHETELFSKVVGMMYDRTVMRCASLTKIDLSVPVKYPQPCHSYMEDLVKDTITVSKVLTRYLPDLKCSLILSQIFDNYKRLFVEAYCTKLPVFKDFNEKHNILKDIDYFRVKLGDVIGYGNSGQVIWENVNSMPTEEDTKMEQIMKHSISDERKQTEKQKEAKLPSPPPPPRPQTTKRLSFERLISSARSSFERHKTEEHKEEPPIPEVKDESPKPESKDEPATSESKVEDAKSEAKEETPGLDASLTSIQDSTEANKKLEEDLTQEKHAEATGPEVVEPEAIFDVTQDSPEPEIKDEKTTANIDGDQKLGEAEADKKSLEEPTSTAAVENAIKGDEIAETYTDQEMAESHTEPSLTNATEKDGVPVIAESNTQEDVPTSKDFQSEEADMEKDELEVLFDATEASDTEVLFDATEEEGAEQIDTKEEEAQQNEPDQSVEATETSSAQVEDKTKKVEIGVQDASEDIPESVIKSEDSESKEEQLPSDESRESEAVKPVEVPEVTLKDVEDSKTIIESSPEVESKQEIVSADRNVSSIGNPGKENLDGVSKGDQDESGLQNNVNGSRDTVDDSVTNMEDTDVVKQNDAAAEVIDISEDVQSVAETEVKREIESSNAPDVEAEISNGSNDNTDNLVDQSKQKQSKPKNQGKKKKNQKKKKK
ncbi:uncharacterized protein J8A68_002715 [[Candida] subhashii]|uniref:Vacuolar protein sorting-associated protein 54 C-terminal domain-containing protein n=1 Tax=[Candida] subhashii TaxID=561895 RepID=A0A8J5UIM4_9ASCO|nr:uncharacterized protein J8A68_002715 [[Candida] subhashii]KAG7663768.1 hypothetical protein J8A68_002715 [[Candida] subhashii]